MIYRRKGSEVYIASVDGNCAHELVGYGEYYPYMFPDEIEFPFLYYAERMSSDNACYFRGCYNGTCLGFGGFDPLIEDAHGMFHVWKNPHSRIAANDKKMIEAAKLILHWGFTEKNLIRITVLCPVRLYNISYYIKLLGFSKEGTIRKCYKYKNKWEDMNLYSILKGELSWAEAD